MAIGLIRTYQRPTVQRFLLIRRSCYHPYLERLWELNRAVYAKGVPLYEALHWEEEIFEAMSRVWQDAHATFGLLVEDTEPMKAVKVLETKIKKECLWRKTKVHNIPGQQGAR